MIRKIILVATVFVMLALPFSNAHANDRECLTLTTGEKVATYCIPLP